MNQFNPKVMFIFPGQGSQYQGMGSDLYEAFAVAKKVYRDAAEVLGFDIAELSFRDPEGKLDTTVYTQPAILTHSIACLEVFKELTEGAVAAEVAGGHSLGEYSALVAGGVLSMPDALRLVQRRGELLSEYGRGLMAAVSLDAETLRGVVPRFYCEIGGCNVPDQTVVGGAEPDLEALTAYLKDNFNARATLLNVEGAFHTYLMVTAAEKFRPYLDAASFAQPLFNILSNYTGAYHPADGVAVKANLFFQIFNPVRWIWGMQHALRDGANMIFEFGGGIGKGEGPGDKRPNLAGITKKAVKSAGRHAVYAPAINAETLQKAAQLAGSLPRVAEEPHGAADSLKTRLYLPVIDGMVTEECAPLLETVAALGLGDDRLRLIAQSRDDNVKELHALTAEEAEKTHAYLISVTDGAVSYYVGEALEARLRGIAGGH